MYDPGSVGSAGGWSVFVPVGTCAAEVAEVFVVDVVTCVAVLRLGTVSCVAGLVLVLVLVLVFVLAVPVAAVVGRVVVCWVVAGEGLGLFVFCAAASDASRTRAPQESSIVRLMESVFGAMTVAQQSAFEEERLGACVGDCGRLREMAVVKESGGQR